MACFKIKFDFVIRKIKKVELHSDGKRKPQIDAPKKHKENQSESFHLTLLKFNFHLEVYSLV